MINLRSSLIKLKNYASYLLTTGLEEIAAAYVQLARNQSASLLNFYDRLSEQELQALARQQITQFLDQVVKDQPLQAVEGLLDRWPGNKLREASSKGLHIEEILCFYTLHKESLLHVLPRYTQDVALAIRIVSQLDGLCKEAERCAFEAYVNLQQQALKQSQTQLLEAQETAHIGSWEWNLSTNQVVWSDEMYRIAGFMPGEIAIDAQAYLDLLHSDDRSATVAAIGKCLAALEPYALEHRIVCKDGSIRWMLCKGKAVLSAEGNVERLLGVAIDITELKRAEKQLRELNEQLEQRVSQRTEELQAAHDQIQVLLAREKTARIQAQQQQQVERLFMQAPVAIAIYQLPDFIVELANEAMCELWGTH